MRVANTVLILLTGAALTLAAVGPGARYLEEIAIGGGIGDPADGGAEIDRTGAIATDSSITAAGDGAFGANSDDHALTVAAGDENTSALRLFETDNLNGAALWYAGATNTLHLGTHDGSTTPTPALEIAQGSGDVEVAGGLSVGLGLQLGPDIELGVESDYLGITVGTGDRIQFYELATELYRMTSTHFHARDGQDLGLSSRRWGTIYADGLDIDGSATLLGGGLVVGDPGEVKGSLTLAEGSEGDQPGVLALSSPAGVVWYLFVEDDGTVRIDSSVPTQNSDGSVIGLQF